MKIAVIGSKGQLGTDLMKVLVSGHQVTGYIHEDIEVSDLYSCNILKKLQPDVIINTAAFHKTDRCEEECLKTFAVNAIGAQNVALISQEIGAIDVYISTDYVFDGRSKEPYTEEDVPNPINAYGISKLAAEHFTRLSPKHYIFRIASAFGTAGASGKGGNFVETMIDKARKGESISVIDDMWMSPTYAKDFASILKTILEQQLPFGVYHATNRGYCSWFQFAQQIFKLTGLNPDLKPIKTEQLDAKARRPRFSALNSIKLPKYEICVPTWQEALREYLIEKNYI